MTSKLKLLIGINGFIREGAPRLVLDQIRYLNRDKYEIALLTFFEFSGRHDFFDLLPEGIKVYRLNFKDFRDVKSWLGLFKILKDFKPDVAISHLFFSNTVLRVLKPFFNYKIFIYEHNTYIKKTKLQILVDKILSYLTRKIIVPVDTVKNFTSNQEKISKDKFAVIANGIDYEKIKSETANYDKEKLKIELGFAKEDKLVINVAKLFWQKNHNLLIDSFAEFAKSNGGYKLIILGEGPRRSLLAKYIKDLHLEDKVFLLGEKKNILEYMLISEFFVLTSKIESFALACVESMALGLPVISTFVGGPDHYIIDGFNGYLVREEDKNVIAQKMMEVAERGKNYFSENCRMTAQKYDIKENVRKIETLIG